MINKVYLISLLTFYKYILLITNSMFIKF